MVDASTISERIWPWSVPVTAASYRAFLRRRDDIRAWTRARARALAWVLASVQIFRSEVAVIGRGQRKERPFDCLHCTQWHWQWHWAGPSWGAMGMGKTLCL